MAVVDPGLPSAEAIRFFAAKGHKVSFDWRDLWQQEHAHAFTVAKSADFDILADIDAAAEAALEQGATPQEFQRRLTPILQQKGWWGRKAVVDPKTGWRCRCRVVRLSARQMQRRGWRVSAVPDVQMRGWLNKRSGRKLQIPVGIDPGFAYNVGLAGRGWAGPPQPPPDPHKIPELDQVDALSDSLGGQQGSNRCGAYRGSDGKVRYVKFYDDPARVYAEAVANRRLDLAASESSIVRLDNGKIAVGNAIVDNRGALARTPEGRRRNLTKAHANKVLDGFAADVWTANWDAVGADLDNIVVTDMRANRLARIDQGGALLFRAQGARKPAATLGQVNEWAKFNSATNPSYKKIFRQGRRRRPRPPCAEADPQDQRSGPGDRRLRRPGSPSRRRPRRRPPGHPGHAARPRGYRRRTDRHRRPLARRAKLTGCARRQGRLLRKGLLFDDRRGTRPG